MFRISRPAALCGLLLLAVPAGVNAALPAQGPVAAASTRTTRVTGVVRDEQNAVTLPGVAVTVVATNETVFTDMDGPYVLGLPAGKHQLKVAMEGYRERTL